MEARRMWALTVQDKKRGEVDVRKMADEDRKLFRRAKEAELQSRLDLKVLDVVYKKAAD